MLAGVIDPDHQGEIGLLGHTEGKEECLQFRKSLRTCLSITMSYN